VCLLRRRQVQAEHRRGRVHQLPGEPLLRLANSNIGRNTT
jgi:hypothetical protein